MSDTPWIDIWQRLGATQDVRFLIDHVAGRDALRTGQHPIEAELDVFDALLARVQQGEPLQYVLGEWDFRTLTLKVDRRALIPRPETEEVVEAALRFLPADDGATVVDLGTGSGAIALSVATERPLTTVHAVDSSAAALQLVAENAERSQVNNVVLHEGSWFEPLPADLRGRVDVIVTNPPYVESAAELEREVIDFEPHDALFAGSDGLDDIRVLLEEAPRWLTPSGVFITELAPHQANTVVQLALASGFAEATAERDMTGRNRWVVAVNPRHPYAS